MRERMLLQVVRRALKMIVAALDQYLDDDESEGSVKHKT